MLFMIKSKENISQMPKRETRYRITASLLNTWQQIWDCVEYVHESEDDEISYETKVAIAQEKKFKEFVDCLNRIPVPDNIHFQKGREFEDRVCSGNDQVFSKYVKDGAFQVKVAKDVDIDGIPITIYGILDVLKAGRIMDIKRTGKYKFPKYKTSHQHAVYLYLVPEAVDFTYLIADDSIEKGSEDGYHMENYIRENTEDIIQTISKFLNWLKANDLFDIYTQKWIMYEI